MSSSSTVAALKKVLADSYALYIKTQNYHWNVMGPNFASLHALFETQYRDLAEAIDGIAERIRALGEKAPGALSAYAELTNIQDGNHDASADQMVKDLYQDQERIAQSLKLALKAAQEVGDEVTIGMIIERMTIHEKNAWMLRASVAN